MWFGIRMKWHFLVLFFYYLDQYKVSNISFIQIIMIIGMHWARHCSNYMYLLLPELFEEDLILICTRGNWGIEIFKQFSQGQIVVYKRVEIRNQAICWLLTLMLLCLKGKNLFMHIKKLICMSSKFIHVCSLKR